MNLRERLRMLRPAVGASNGARARATDAATGGESRAYGVAAGGGSAGIEATDRGCSRHAQIPHFGHDIALTSFPTEAGPVLCTEQSYPLTHEQGSISLDMALTVSELGWRRLLPLADESFPIERAIFLDLETTGLSRGAGTYAFLIGVGRFTDDGFRLRQFFMRDYDDEYAVLEALRTELHDAGAIVTFNGRSFDWPLLEARATINRLPLPRLPHLDLLHPARRVWRPVIGGCSLSDLESAVLGFERQDDVPGFLIPQLYFDFLQTGDAEPLTGVLGHNRLDILSMAALVGYVGRAVEAPRTFAHGGQVLSGAELFTIGRWLLPEAEGIACLEEALDRGLSPELRRQCSRLLATAYKRTDRAEAAVAIWESLTAEDGLSTWAYIELAKHYEHRVRDLHAARQWTVRALDLIHRRRSLGGVGRSPIALRGAVRDPFEQELAEVLHRLQRIERKLRS